MNKALISILTSISHEKLCHGSPVDPGLILSLLSVKREKIKFDVYRGS